MKIYPTRAVEGRGRIVRLLLYASCITLGVFLAWRPGVAVADGGGFPTATLTPTTPPTFTPTPTLTLIPTSQLIVFPPTLTPTPLGTPLALQPIPELLVATPPSAASRIVTPLSCGIFALVVLLLAILGFMYLRTQIREEAT